MLEKENKEYSALKKAVRRQMFYAPFWSIFINPIYIARRGLAKAISSAIKQSPLSGIWVDVGCGQRPYELWFNVEKYIGVDVKQSGYSEKRYCDIVYDGKILPFASDSIDGVLCTQVLEHVMEPESFISEIARILKPGGKLILTVPFLWQEHEKPYDFKRFTSFGLTRLLELQGFRIGKYCKTTGNIEAIAQLISLYICNNLVFNLPGWRHIITLILCAPVQIIGILLQKVLPDKRGLFLDNVVVAYKSAKKSE